MEAATQPQRFEIGAVLSDSWALYRRHFARFVAVAAIVFVLLGLVQALVSAATGGGVLTAFVWGLAGAIVGLVGSTS